MNNALLYIGGFLVVVLAALFAVPHFIDWNSYRGVFEEEATRVLGRDVRIGGAVNLRLLPTPSVSLEKLKIADPGSSTGESLFRADSFTVWLSVPPLLKGVFEANKIEVRRPVVQLVASPEGGGNWNSLSINAGQMPLVPKGVTLQSVTITDGAMVIGTTARPEIARLEAINGELSADALNGPYKFAGTLTSGGASRDVRLATSSIEDNQELRFKANVRTLDTGNTYTLSGKATDLKERAKLEGDLTAELNVTLLSSADAPAGSVPKSEVTAKLNGDASGVELKDIALTLQQAATPQLVSGSAKVTWPERTQVEVALASRWLDFDKLSGSAKAVPVDVARQLFDALSASLPTEADTSTKVMLDQVTLGGDAVSDVRFEASRAGGGALELKGVRASLPGGARVEFDGQLAGAGAARAFSGAVALSGQSLLRFATWGMATEGLVSARADGPFALQGDLALSQDSISVRNARAEIAATPLSGEFTSSFGAHRAITLVVEGERIDADAIWPASLDSRLASQLLGLDLPVPGAQVSSAAISEPDAKTADAAAPAAVSPPKEMDIRIRLRSAELVYANRELKNVDADFALEKGALSMPRLRFTSADGLSVDLEGETNVAAGKGRAGQVRGVVDAPDAAALASLGKGLGLLTGEGQPHNLPALAPLRLAGSVTFGARTERSADVQLDGIAGNARVTGNLLLDGGWQAWRVSPSDVTLSAESGNIARTLAALLGTDARLAALDFEPPRPGRLAIKTLSGTDGGFLSNVSLRAEGIDAEFDGTSKFDATEGWQSAGDVRIKADDARSVLALAGLRSGKGAGQAALDGTFAVASSKSGKTFVFENVQAGASTVSGRVALNAAAPGPDASAKEPSVSLDADLKISSAELPALLAFLTTDTTAAIAAAPQPEAEDKTPPVGNKRRRLSAAATAPLPVMPEPSVWSAHSFDPGLMSGLSGKIRAAFGTLSLEPGLGMSDAVLEATITPGRVDVAKLEGKALGGAVTSSFSLDKDPIGIKMTAAMVLTAGGTSGKDAMFKADASGRASSPAGLIADLKGKGELVLAEGALHVNSPAALSAVAEAALQAKGPAVAGEELATAVSAALKDSKQTLGGFSVPFIIADGAMRFDKVQVDTEEGRSKFGASIELDTLKLESEWQIEPKVRRPAGGERQILAPVAVIYKGKLRDVGTLEPEIAISALERELSVRKMERDVEELERLRKDDQARAAEEKARRDAVEAERVKAIAAQKSARDAAAAAGLPPSPVPQGAAPPAPGQPADAPANNGASLAPVDPTSTTSGPQSESAAVGAADTATQLEGSSNLGRPANAVQPLVRKKRPPDNKSWQPFQTTPY